MNSFKIILIYSILLLALLSTSTSSPTSAAQHKTLVAKSRRQGPKYEERSPKKKVVENIKKLKEKLLLHVPLFCWKVLINCRRFSDHVCCPVMPGFLGEGAAKRGKRAVVPSDGYVDPMFGIRLAHPPLPYYNYYKRSWKPFTCPVDCSVVPRHRCCPRQQAERRGITSVEQEPLGLQRLLPVVFEKFGGDPDSYQLARGALLWGLLAAGLAAWAWLGQVVGAVGGRARKVGTALSDEYSTVDLSSRVVLAVEGVDWLPGLTERLRERVEEGEVTSFLCCLTPSAEAEQNEVVRRKKEAKGLATMECYRSRRQLRSDSTGQVQVDCPSKLMYKFKLAAR